MKIVIFSITLFMASCVVASPPQPSNSLIQSFEMCSAPLLQFDAALSAASNADDKYDHIYDEASVDPEAARNALRQSLSSHTAATALGYQLIGATPQSVTKLEAAETSLDSKIVDLIEPATKPSKTSLNQLSHDVDADEARVDAIVKTMNSTLGLSSNTKIGNILDASIENLLMMRADKCRTKVTAKNTNASPGRRRSNMAAR